MSWQLGGYLLRCRFLRRLLPLDVFVNVWQVLLLLFFTLDTELGFYSIVSLLIFFILLQKIFAQYFIRLGRFILERSDSYLPLRMGVNPWQDSLELALLGLGSPLQIDLRVENVP
jgi:hypothetical protein